MTLTLTQVFLSIAAAAVVLTALRWSVKKPQSLLVLLIQHFIGLFFIFSGFVKAIDPLGTSYKIEEYFVEFGVDFLVAYSLPFSVFTIVLEIVLGVTLLIGFLKDTTAALLLALIVFFTVLTGFTYLSGYEIGKWYNPSTWVFNELNMKVTDCGCFGDFLKIKPYHSFLKDVFLTVLIVFLFIQRKKIDELFSPVTRGVVTAVAVVGFTLFCFRNFAWNLPLFDFRPYKVGNYLPDLMKEIPDKVEYIWVYQDKNSGAVQEFSDAEFMQVSSQPGFKDKYQFVDRKVGKVLQKGVPAKINNFQIINEHNEDVSEDILYYPDYQMLVIAYDLEHTKEKAFQEKLNPLASEAQKAGIPFFVVTAASSGQIAAFREKNGISYPVYTADPVFLKTIIRSNPGLVLLKEGTVMGKWHHRHIPSYDELNRNFLKR
ncbi:MAG: hypothetical protein KatS3mg031_2596 [Chitinophagales bacterium]|nr:MAG: hypothetical protein KatS3mg031_2596 [Chitinophagales bacterium]